jgi:hypothetical protein
MQEQGGPKPKPQNLRFNRIKPGISGSNVQPAVSFPDDDDTGWYIDADHNVVLVLNGVDHTISGKNRTIHKNPLCIKDVSYIPQNIKEDYGTLYKKKGHPGLWWKTNTGEVDLTTNLNVYNSSEVVLDDEMLTESEVAFCLPVKFDDAELKQQISLLQEQIKKLSKAPIYDVVFSNKIASKIIGCDVLKVNNTVFLDKDESTCWKNMEDAVALIFKNALILSASNLGLSLNTTLILQDQESSKPTLSTEGHLYKKVGSDSLWWSTNNVNVELNKPHKTLNALDGSLSAPSISFEHEPNTGFYKLEKGGFAVAVLGSKVYNMNYNSVEVFKPVLLYDVNSGVGKLHKKPNDYNLWWTVDGEDHCLTQVDHLEKSNVDSLEQRVTVLEESNVDNLEQRLTILERKEEVENLKINLGSIVTKLSELENSSNLDQIKELLTSDLNQSKSELMAQINELKTTLNKYKSHPETLLILNSTVLDLRNKLNSLTLPTTQEVVVDEKLLERITSLESRPVLDVTGITNLIKDTVENYKSDLEKIYSNVVETTGKLDEANINITQLTSLSDVLTSKVGILEVNEEALTSTIAQLQVNNEELTSSVSSVVEQVKVNNEALTTVVSSVAEQVKVNNEALTNKTATLEVNQEALTNKTATLEVNQEALTNKTATLEVNQEALTTVVSSLAEQVKVNQEALTTDLAQVKVNQEALTTDLAQVKVNNEALTTDLAQVKVNNEALTTDLAQVKVNNEALTTDLAQVKVNNEALTNKVTNIVEEINEVNTSISQHQVTIDKVQLNDSMIKNDNNILLHCKFNSTPVAICTGLNLATDEPIKEGDVVYCDVDGKAHKLNSNVWASDLGAQQLYQTSTVVRCEAFGVSCIVEYNEEQNNVLCWLEKDGVTTEKKKLFSADVLPPNYTLNLVLIPGEVAVCCYKNYKTFIMLPADITDDLLIGETIYDNDSDDSLALLYDLYHGILYSVERTISNALFLQVYDIYGMSFRILKSKRLPGQNLTFVDFRQLDNNTLLLWYKESNTQVAQHVETDTLAFLDKCITENESLYYTAEQRIEHTRVVGLAQSDAVENMCSVVLRSQVFNSSISLKEHVGSRMYLTTHNEKSFPNNLSNSVVGSVLTVVVVNEFTMLVL